MRATDTRIFTHFKKIIMVATIKGYFKDDQTDIDGFVVTDENDRYIDEDIFFYMSEAELIDAVDKAEDTIHDFVITSYKIEPTSRW